MVYDTAGVGSIAHSGPLTRRTVFARSANDLAKLNDPVGKMTTLPRILVSLDTGNSVLMS